MAFVTVLNVNGLSLSRSGDYKHPALQVSNGSFRHKESCLKIQKEKKKNQTLSLCNGYFSLHLIKLLFIRADKAGSRVRVYQGLISD